MNARPTLLQKTETPPNFSGGISILSKPAFQAACKGRLKTKNLALRQHGTKGQVNAWGVDFAAFHNGVPPMALRAAAHHDELSVLQHKFAFFLRLFVFEGEFPRCAEADGCDNGVFA